MCEYKRLNLSTIKFSGIKSTDEAIKNVDLIEFPEDVLNGTRKILINKVEKETNNKLKIFY